MAKTHYSGRFTGRYLCGQTDAGWYAAEGERATCGVCLRCAEAGVRQAEPAKVTWSPPLSLRDVMVALEGISGRLGAIERHLGIGEAGAEPPPGMPVHYTPEEHDQPACEDDGPGFVMLGTLNPDQVTCEACLALTGNSAAGGESGDG
jgi:hypothetical protein